MISKIVNTKQPGAEEPFTSAGRTAEFPIVGIGASAGGLEALEAFFQAVPADSGFAFVVITHTDPAHESMLPDLLKRKTNLPIELIVDGMKAEPDTVYLPPSSLDPILSGGIFRLQKRPDKSEIHMPVDLFLRHLAADQGVLAAGIILSGTGTDGTHGIRLIKEKDGMAIAQSPESARHAGMPKSAIETGLVDYVLSPSEMPERLIQYFRNPVAIRPRSRSGERERRARLSPSDPDISGQTDKARSFPL